MNPPSSLATPLEILPLENGDRLNRLQFERRYHAMAHIKKAELIKGVVYVPSPLRYRNHSKPHFHIITWLGVYKAATPGVDAGDNATVRLDENNEPQPDVLLRIEEGGQSIVSEDDYIEGAPELIVEIAASSASYDLHEKLQIYCSNRVQEYLVWRVYDGVFDWYYLEGEEYIQLEPEADGIIRSLTFPGLWLDRVALLEDDIAGVLAVVQEGLATPEHQAFIGQLGSTH